MKTHVLRTAALAAAVAGLAACATSNTNTGEANENNPRTEASARLTSAAGGAALPNPQSPTQGAVKFSQVRDIVSASGSVTGLAPNARHAFHVHEKGDCSSPDFNSAGGHFNPTSQPHGAHGSGKHHLGDMPELVTDASGTANIGFNSSSLKLRGPNSIIGKAVIVHAAPDDVNAQPTGNAGARLVCGVIKQD
ncbi:MAG: superoxide dismutase family protein [Burkholderiales bacterium]|nr:superoxide dismutase family protein [Burkholderiales bacterium]